MNIFNDNAIDCHKLMKFRYIHSGATEIVILWFLSKIHNWFSQISIFSKKSFGDRNFSGSLALFVSSKEEKYNAAGKRSPAMAFQNASKNPLCHFPYHIKHDIFRKNAFNIPSNIWNFGTPNEWT